MAEKKMSAKLAKQLESLRKAAGPWVTITDDLVVEAEELYLRKARLSQLPEGLTVKGDLYLESCNSLKALPASLKVEGNLVISEANKLAVLPEGMEIGGKIRLNLYNTLLETLPKGYSWKSISITYGVLKTLPEGMNVEDYLLLTCVDVTSIGSGLHVGGSMSLVGCENLTSIGEGLTVGGSLEIINCPELETIPEEIHVGRNVKMGSCEKLQALPQSLSVIDGELYLSFCKALTKFPEGLSVSKSLYLDNTSITELPKGLKKVGGHLHLPQCLKSLPEGLEVGGDLDLGRCSEITALPEGLIVGNDLRLFGCTGLTALPKVLSVGGDLNLRGCVNLKDIPATIQVGGEIIRD